MSISVFPLPFRKIALFLGFPCLQALLSTQNLLLKFFSRHYLFVLGYLSFCSFCGCSDFVNPTPPRPRGDLVDSSAGHGFSRQAVPTFFTHRAPVRPAAAFHGVSSPFLALKFLCYYGGGEAFLTRVGLRHRAGALLRCFSSSGGWWFLRFFFWRLTVCWM